MWSLWMAFAFVVLQQTFNFTVNLSNVSWNIFQELLSMAGLWKQSQNLSRLWSFQSLQGVCLSLGVIYLLCAFYRWNYRKMLFLISEIYIECYVTSQLIKGDKKSQGKHNILSVWQISLFQGKDNILVTVFIFSYNFKTIATGCKRNTQ